MRATSSRCGPSGPAVSWLCAMGMMPSWATSPSVGFSPTMPLLPAGRRSSRRFPCRSPAAHRFAGGAYRRSPSWSRTDPSSRHVGIAGEAPRALQPFKIQVRVNNGLRDEPRKFAHSERFALPRMTAPAARSRATSVASRGHPATHERERTRRRLHRVSVAMLSLTRIGMPCSGPRTRPAWRSPSRRAAIPRACGFVSITA